MSSDNVVRINIGDKKKLHALLAATRELADSGQKLANAITSEIEKAHPELHDAILLWERSRMYWDDALEDMTVE